MESTVLTSKRLNVQLDFPGSHYRASRFDWTSQVRQVTLDGQWSFLTREKLAVESPSAQGWGLAGEFGIATPVGYQDCPVGETFPKIGIGELTRTRRQKYHFATDYPLQEARFTVESLSSREVLLTAESSSSRGYAWSLQRRWSVRDEELLLETSLTNRGDKTLQTEEYMHNFMRFQQEAVGPAWSLNLPRSIDRTTLVEFVDPQHLLEVSEGRVTWKRTPGKDFFLADHSPDLPRRWQLHHQDLGLSVQEEVDFEPTAFHLWGCGHVVSPELFHQLDLPPGASTNWNRRWKFEHLPTQGLS